MSLILVESSKIIADDGYEQRDYQHTTDGTKWPNEFVEYGSGTDISVTDLNRKDFFDNKASQCLLFL